MFRFCLIYFSLFVIFSQMWGHLLRLPAGVRIPNLGTAAPMRQLVLGVARRLFGIQRELRITGGGSGDKTYDWILVFCLLLIAMTATLAWVGLQRKIAVRPQLRRGAHLGLRLALGSTMIYYGMAKLIPMQMPVPELSRLLRPLGMFLPQGVLWASIGIAPAYEMFLGFAEVLGGALLFLPHTWLVGALLCLAETTQVFVLNVSYDIGVKLLSFHLLLLSVYLIAPEAQRLLAILHLARAVPPSAAPPLLASRRGNAIATALQAMFCIYIVIVSAQSILGYWHLYYSERAPKSPFYGVWDVVEMSIDGQLRTPLLTDAERFRRVLFEAPRDPLLVTFQRMDDSFLFNSAELDEKTGTLKLRGEENPQRTSTWSVLRPAADQLILDGEAAGHRIHLQLRLFDPKQFPVLKHRIRLIQEQTITY